MEADAEFAEGESGCVRYTLTSYEGLMNSMNIMNHGVEVYCALNIISQKNGFFDQSWARDIACFI